MKWRGSNIRRSLHSLRNLRLSLSEQQTVGLFLQEGVLTKNSITFGVREIALSCLVSELTLQGVNSVLSISHVLNSASHLPQLFDLQFHFIVHFLLLHFEFFDFLSRLLKLELK